MLRQIEVLSGAAAGILGILLPTYGVLFGGHPISSEPTGVFAILLIYAMVITIGVISWLDARYPIDAGTGLGLALLWTATATLWGMVLTIHLGIDLYILPAAILALIACIAGTLVQLRITPAR